MDRLAKNFKACATCSLWCGSRTPDATRSTVAYPRGEKGECVGGGFNRLQTTALTSCNRYQQWIK